MQEVITCEKIVGLSQYPLSNLVNANQNWLSICTGTEKNALLISMTEKNLPSGLILFNNVEGSGTIGALWITAEFTACRSCTILQPVDGGAFFTGNNGVFTSESLHSLITPAYNNACSVGFIPSTTSGFSGYWRWWGLWSPFGLICTGSYLNTRGCEVPGRTTHQLGISNHGEDKEELPAEVEGGIIANHCKSLMVIAKVKRDSLYAAYWIL